MNVKVMFFSLALLGCLLLGIAISRVSSRASHFELGRALKLSCAQAAQGKLSQSTRRNLASTKTGSRESLTLSKATTRTSLRLAQEEGGSGQEGGVETSLWRIKGYLKGINETNNFLKEKIVLLNSLLEAKEKEALKLSEENARLKDEIATTAKLEDKLKAKFSAVLSNLNREIAQRDLSISKFETVKLNLQTEINNLNNKINSLANNQSGLETQLHEAQLAKKASEEELARIKEELGKQLASNEALNKNVADLAAALNEKEKERKLIAGELEQLQSFKTNIETELGDLKSSKNDLAQTYVNLENRLNDASSAKAALEEELNRVKADLNKQIAVNEELERNLAQLSGTSGDRDKEREAALSELEALRASKVSYEGEVDGLRKARAQDEMQIQELQSNIAQLSKDYEETKKSYAELSAVIAKKELEANNKQNDVALMKALLDKTNDEKNSLLAELEEKEKSIAGLRQSVNNMETQLTEMQNALASGKDYQREAAENLQQAKALNDSLKKKVSSLYVELELLRAENNTEGR